MLCSSQRTWKRIVLSYIELSRCSIVSDGWSNIQRKPLINVMIASPKRETFVRAIDPHGQIKSGLFIANVITTVIEEVGAKNVVQILMDNAKSCKNTNKISQNWYPHVYPSSCNMQGMNLVLKDWYKNDDT